MAQPGPNPYLRTKILTANPEELRLMLYDGAIKFCRQAVEALGQHDAENSYNCLMRAQKIVLELSTSLNHRIAPELCDKLSALYTYIYRLLVDSNLKREAGPVTEALRLLEFERETWRMLMQRLAEDSGRSAASAAPDMVKAQQTAMSSLKA